MADADISLISMLLLGLLGTGHCLGMCGPLVLALPFTERGFWAHLTYHLGRVATYSAVGAAMAGLGAALRHAASLSGGDPLGSVARLQVVLSLVAALLLMVFGLARLGLVREPSILTLASPGRLPGFRRLQERGADRSGLARPFILGLFLGLLPCGLSYAAFSRALAAPDPASGAALAAVFGLGTMPGLLVLGTGGAAFARKHRRLADILAGALLVVMAVSLAVDAVTALI